MSWQEVVPNVDFSSWCSSIIPKKQRESAYDDRLYWLSLWALGFWRLGFWRLGFWRLGFWRQSLLLSRRWL
jgi:hypothetical protein